MSQTPLPCAPDDRPAPRRSSLAVRNLRGLTLLAIVAWLLPMSSLAAEQVTVGGLRIDPEAYRDSAFFPAGPALCGTGDPAVRALFFPSDPSPAAKGGAPSGADCSETSSLGANATNLATYDLDGAIYRIPVVVHILLDLEDGQCLGQISDARVHSQIEILNEDFRALWNSPGQNGLDVGIEFFLATEDPDGEPTSGIERWCDRAWFLDGDDYWDFLAWDPHNYLNIYVNNSQPGVAGYVPFLPADGGGTMVGARNDRVVIYHETFGRDSPAPFQDQGRVGTHEVGHYLGLEHVFLGCGAATAPGCHSDGDLICDTFPQDQHSLVCPSSDNSCGSPDNLLNYMDYTVDDCKEEFVADQGRRMRCTLHNWRPDLAEISFLFGDGFESGSTAAWGG